MSVFYCFFCYRKNVRTVDGGTYIVQGCGDTVYFALRHYMPVERRYESCATLWSSQEAIIIFTKPLGLLFPGIDKKGTAMQYIMMNFIANLLGLGNASTPLGIKAVQELKNEQKAEKTATRDMIMLVVMNTASVQFFPSTIVAIRASYRSTTPADIVPCVWIVSLIALGVSVVTVFAAERISSRRKKK